VSAIVTTHLQRTQLTAKPIADSLGLQLIVVRAGSPLQAHLDSVAATVKRQAAGSVVLVVGHSNTVPGIIAALGGPRLPDLCDSQYASLFIMSFPATGTPRLIRSSYGAADGPPSQDCARMMRP
jgi:broad specificity phosphatase PhoE